MFSKELEQSIANLFDQAQDQNLEYLTIEHLLLMLLSDFEVRQALETNDVNIATLRENLEEHVRDNTPSKVDAKKPVQPTLGFQRVLQRAVFHVQSSGKGVVKPINLLVAIFSEKESHSVFLLSKQGIGRLDIVSYISHGKPDGAKAETDSESSDEEIVTESATNNNELEFLIDLNALAESTAPSIADFEFSIASAPAFCCSASISNNFPSSVTTLADSFPNFISSFLVLAIFFSMLLCFRASLVLKVNKLTVLPVAASNSTLSFLSSFEFICAILNFEASNSFCPLSLSAFSCFTLLNSSSPIAAEKIDSPSLPS